MGAIQKEGYTFEVEYSVMLQKAALHVYQNGEFLQEIPFQFTGQEPDPQQIEHIVDDFINKKNE